MTTVSTTSRSSRLSRAIADAPPPLLPTLGGAVLWGIAMGVSAACALVIEAWETPGKIGNAAAIFTAGGAAAFPVALIVARFLSYGRNREAAFAAAFLSLAATTALAVGGIFALDYRSYYAEWHEETFTRVWFLQFAHTIIAALYQFAVLGLRLFFPVGFVGLIIASAWFARRAR